MKYNDLQRQYTELRRESLAKQKQINDITAQINNISNLSVKSSTDYQIRYSEAKRAAEDKYKRELLAPVEKELQESKSLYSALQSDYNAEKADLTEENILKNCSSQQEILKEVRESAKTLADKIKSIIGVGFYKELNHQLSRQTIALEEQDLDRVIAYFNQCSELFTRMTEKPSVVADFIDEAEGKLRSVSSDRVEQNKTAVAIVAILSLICIVVFFKYLSPMYVAAVLFVSIYKVIRSYKIYKIVVVQKAVQDNIDSIDALIRKQVLEELESRSAEIENYYQEQFTLAKENISDLQYKLTNLSATAAGSFQFDDSLLKRETMLEEDRNSRKTASLAAERRKLEKESDEILDNINRVKEEMDKLLGSIKEKYLDFSKAGTDLVFKPEFLFDIDDVKCRPIFYEHPKTSTLFLYDNENDAFDFVRLMNMQLRRKMNPSSISVVVYDNRTMGADLLAFTPPAKDKDDETRLKQLFSIISDESGFNSILPELVSDIKRRSLNIKNDAEDINSYNEKMAELDSLPLAYKFLYVMNPSTSILGNADLGIILRVGGTAGVYTHLLLSADEFKTMGQCAKDLVAAVGKIYILQGGSFKERAKDFVMENMIEQQGMS